jgi:alkylation response protein AidB-like acyl-CoA dehydrogenase
VRRFAEKELIPNISKWEEEGEFPTREIVQKCYQEGIYACNWPVEYGGTPPEVKGAVIHKSHLFTRISTFFIASFSMMNSLDVVEEVHTLLYLFACLNRF